MKKIVIILILFILLLSACNNQEPTATPEPEPATAVPPTAEPTAEEVVAAEPDSLQPSYEPLPLDQCFASPMEGVEITVDYDCGYVVVPEFYQGESTRTVKVPFLRFNSPNDTTASPVLLHPGGPGETGINELTFSTFSIMFNEVIPDRDVIFMDPRGTEHADTFLDCPAYYSLGWQAYEQGLDEEAGKALLIETVQSCMDDFQAQGVNLDAYNSLELAGDVNSVRQALGYEQIIYFGTSYGSQLGQHIMRDYPEILEAVILNGSSPLSRQSWIEDRAFNIQTVFDNLVDLCIADEKCNEDYPDIPGLLDAALANFDDGPVPYTYTDPNDPSLTVEVEVAGSNVSGYVHAYLSSQYAVLGTPFELASLASPEQKEATVTLLGDTSAQSLIAGRTATKGEEALLMHFAVVCSDDTVKSEDELIIDGVSQFAIDASRGEAELYATMCSLLNVKELPDGTDENVTTDIPTLLLSGSLDISTPPIRSQIIADALPNATHVIIPGHTHDQLGSFSVCAKTVLTQFIANPDMVPDSSCVETPDPKYTGFTLLDGTGSLLTEEEADSEPATGDALVANSWQWTSFTNPADQFDIDTPQNYVLTFYDDGSVTIVADCNTVLGTYGTDAGSLTVELGPTTLAACAPESYSDQFTQYLSSAARYFFEDGNLYIDLMSDGGTMTFAPVDLEGLVDESAIVSSLPADLVTQLDAYLQSQVYTDGGNPELAAPGLVLLVDTPNGRYLNSAGVSNLADGDLMQVDDILEIGSNTKSMTIVVLMQLIEEGLLTLDDTFDQWLPEQAALFENSDQMTLRRLAQHTAGLWDYGDDIIGGGLADPALLEAQYTPEELVQYAADNGTPYFEPGAEDQWQYSNTGYILLGMILEKATGQSLAELYQTRIFDPLGMESAVLIEGVPQEGEITTHGYYSMNGAMMDTTNWNASQGWAAGAVAMNAADLATYGHALSMGQFFHNPETFAEMIDFYPAAGTKLAPYGLGLLDFVGDGSAWGHEGQTIGYQSLWLTDPEAGIVIVALTNSASYSANNLLNVLHIVRGEGAKPLASFTFMPVGEQAPTVWMWSQFVTPAESTAIDPEAGFKLTISQDQSLLLLTNECGIAVGTYTTDGTGQIDFELDGSTISCESDSLAGQLVQHLNDATRWHYDNGNLVVELPADGGSLIFAVPTQ